MNFMLERLQKWKPSRISYTLVFQVPPDKAFGGSKHFLTRYLEDFGKLLFFPIFPVYGQEKNPIST